MLLQGGGIIFQVVLAVGGQTAAVFTAFDENMLITESSALPWLSQQNSVCAF